MRTPICTLLAFLLIISIRCNEEQPIANDNTVIIAGSEYKTVTISGLTWTAVNHAGEGGLVYDAANSRPEYGKYYTFNEVKNITLPEGWRIPTMDDYKKLAASHSIVIPSYNNEAIKALTSATRWLNVPGVNSSGFNAYPAGYSFNNSQPMDGDIAEFWTYEGNTLSIQEGANASLRIMFYGGSTDPAYRFNVRFVRN